MGLKEIVEKITRKKEEAKPEEKKEKPEEKVKAEVKPEEKAVKAYGECSYCSKPGADKKWMGQYFHKKCLRALKKMSKKMI